MKSPLVSFHRRLAQSKIRCIAKTYAPWIKRGTKILDVGCGNGIVAYGLSRLLSVDITGCDQDHYLLEKIPYVPMKKEGILPFDSHSFDIVMFNDVLHHTSKENQAKLLKEALRIAKNSVLLFEAQPTVSTYLFDYLINKIYHPGMPLPLTFRSVKAWQQLFLELPAHCETTMVKRPFLSPFARVTFRLCRLN